VDLVATMATASGWTKADADRALRAFLASVRTSLKRGQPVTLVGFGTFSVTRRKPRRGKNPRTGPPMNVVAGEASRFQPFKEVKRAGDAVRLRYVLRHAAKAASRQEPSHRPADERRRGEDAALQAVQGAQAG